MNTINLDYDNYWNEIMTSAMNIMYPTFLRSGLDMRHVEQHDRLLQKVEHYTRKLQHSATINNQMNRNIHYCSKQIVEIIIIELNQYQPPKNTFGTIALYGNIEIMTNTNCNTIVVHRFGR